MKRKTVMRLLAVVMAASLAATNVPGTALMGTETVYADEGDATATYSTITVTAAEGSKYKALPADAEAPKAGDSGWQDPESDGAGGYKVVFNDLTPGTSYKIYTLAEESVGENPITQSTKKIDLSADLTDFTLDPSTFVYDGNEHKPTVASITVGNTTLTSGEDYEVTYSSDVTNVNAEHKVTITAKTGGSKCENSKEIAFTITALTSATAPTLEVTADSLKDKSFGVTIKNYDKMYTYEYAIVKSTEGEPASGAYTELKAATFTSATNLDPATEYTVYCRVKSTDNHPASDPVTTLAVTTAAEELQDAKVTLTTTSGTYDGTDQTPTVTVQNSKNETITNGATVYYTVAYYKRNEDGSNGASVSELKAAGSYNVVVTGNNTNYSGSVTKTFTINKKTVKATAQSVENKTYDGNTDVKVTAKFDDNEIVEGDTVTLPTLTGTLASADAGESISLSSVTSTEVVLGGKDAGNYTLGTVAANSLTATISKQSNVTITGKDAYTVAVGQTIKLDVKNNVGAKMKYTLVDGDGQNVTDEAFTVGEGTIKLNKYSDKTGLKIKVEIDTTDSGYKADNYEVGDVSKLISLTFEKQKPYIKITGTTGYDSATKKFVMNTADETTFKTDLAAKLYYVSDNATEPTETELSDKTLTYTYEDSNGGALEAFPTGEGTYKVKIGYTPAAGDDATNINAAEDVTITLVIAAKKDLTITVDAKSYTIGGSAPSYSYTATAGGSKVTLSNAPTYKICEKGTTTEVALGSITEAGTYDIVATFTLDAAETALYTLASSTVKGTLTVTKSDGTLLVDTDKDKDKDKDTSGTTDTTEPTIKENEDGTKTIVDADGKVIANDKVTIDGKSYITGNDGEVLTSQIAETPSGNKVYVGKDGVIVKNKAVTCDGKKYYATRTGKIATNGFVTTAKGNKVYATKSGALKVSKTFTVDGKKYYAKASGAIATTGFVKTASGNTVYATKSGALKVNKAFKAADGKKYVADKNGKIVKGKKITIGNKTYTTNKKGVIVKVATKKR